MTYEKTCSNLLKALSKYYPKQTSNVFRYERCELEGDFLGFIEEYEVLSKIIPKNFTIVDLGCYAGAQGFYFRNHKKYIGVDLSNCVRWNCGNAKHYTMSINDFIDSDDYKKLNQQNTFAICHYVPTNTEKLRASFKNLFVYYPSREK